MSDRRPPRTSSGGPAQTSPGEPSIFRFWAPLAATWLMMAVEAPYLAALIARLPLPEPNLASYGVAYAFAILVESPVIMILSAATALVEHGHAYRRLRNFTYALNTLLTLGMLVLVLPPVFAEVGVSWIGLPGEVSEGTRRALLLLLPWPGAIGYRRFFQGLLIREGRTRLVAYGTVVRVGTMAIAGLVLARYTRLPGASVGGAALSAGVVAEAAASRWMARGLVRRLLAEPHEAPPGGSLGYSRIARFYYPLALTSTISLAVSPLVTLFMGQARFPLESLAVLPVVLALTFVFRALGLSYQEVAIARLARGARELPRVMGFAWRLAAGTSLALGLIVFTPLAEVWFQRVSGLADELTRFALLPARLLVVSPALTAILSLQRALLVHARNTRPITWASLAEVLGVLALLLLTVHGLDVAGAVAAAIALVGGRLAANVSVLGACAAVVRPLWKLSR